jgi:hypothetical protein
VIAPPLQITELFMIGVLSKVSEELNMVNLSLFVKVKMVVDREVLLLEGNNTAWR